MLSGKSNEAEDYLFNEQREKKSAIPDKGFRLNLQLPNLGGGEKVESSGVLVKE